MRKERNSHLQNKQDQQDSDMRILDKTTTEHRTTTGAWDRQADLSGKHLAPNTCTAHAHQGRIIQTQCSKAKFIRFNFLLRLQLKIQTDMNEPLQTLFTLQPFSRHNYNNTLSISRLESKLPASDSSQARSLT